MDDFGNVSVADLAAALPVIKELGVPLLVHAELVDHDVPPQVGRGRLSAREGDAWSSGEGRGASGRGGEGQGEVGRRRREWLFGSVCMPCGSTTERKQVQRVSRGQLSSSLAASRSPVPCLQGNPRLYSTWLESRPRHFEKNAIQAFIELLKKGGRAGGGQNGG